MSSFSTLLKSLSTEDFSGAIKPVLEKLLKKNPDSILDAFASLVENVSIDLSIDIDVFLPPLLRQLRSAKEHVRGLSIELIGTLAHCCDNPKVWVYLSQYIFHVS